MHGENVDQMELLKDPLIVVTGGELVARELVAREHHSQRPGERGRAASADRKDLHLPFTFAVAA